MAPIPGIGASTGPQLFGFFLNFTLMGALVVQTYHYYVSFPRDRAHIKAIVYSLFVLEMVQTVLMAYSAYKIFGSGYGDLDAFNEIQVDWFSVCILGAIIPGTVQAFYAHRLYMFSGSKIAGGIVLLLAAMATVCGIVQGVFSKLTVFNSELTAKPTLVIIWMVSGVLCDVIIAGTMIYYLQAKRRRTLSPRIRDAVTRIVRYTVETGAITAIFAIVLLVLFVAFPNNNYYAVPNRPLAKLYSNNLLVLLNARAVVLGGRTDVASRESDQAYVNEIRLDTSGNVNAGPLHLEATKEHEMTRLPSSSSNLNDRPSPRVRSF
ncbi:hypothetical protein HGRIS_003133 [Hohenbuehelia grisea]|uniref:DUF6534 domain-containing protein n=1 Tax=Hohenbuehelia grisea TaxID=104357 RepID=A0ABR3JNX4_9AGAR